MVPVDHVVGVVELVNVDRRQLIALDHGGVYAGPPVPQPAIDGQECRVEIGGLGFGRRGADHPIERYLLHAAEGLALHACRFQHAVQREQAP